MYLGTKQELIEFDFYVSPDGEEYNLNDGASLFLMGQGGHGMPPITYMTEQAPFQHGVTPTDYRIQPRLIQMLHRNTGNNRTKFWENRADIINKLRPNRQLANQFNRGALRKIMPDGETRDIDVLIDQGPQFSMKDPGIWDEWGFTEILRFLAFNPFFYNPTQSNLTFVLSALSNLIFPITFLITFGSTILSDTQILTYLGTWLEYPIIQITGPLDGPTIYNDTTGESIEILYNIAAGDVLTINLADRLKTVESVAAGDLQGTVEGDLGTFHIAADPEAPNGLNSIRVTGAGASPGTTQVKMFWNNRYIGL